MLTLRLSAIASIVGNRHHHVAEMIGRRLPTRPTSARKLDCRAADACSAHDVGVSIDWYSISIALTYEALRFKYLRAVRCKWLQALSGSSTFGPSLVLPSY